MDESKRILLYFGSFNPVHRGHVAIAEYAVEKGLADEVVLVVSPQSPHKEQDGLASEFHRYEMAELAAAGSRYPDRILVSLVEAALPKPSYTINTLRFLKKEFPGVEFSILMGADLARGLDTWKDSSEITEGYDIYVYPRPGEDAGACEGRIKTLADAPLFDVSSTEIRRRYLEGSDIGGLVPPGVAEYIEKHRLWS